MKIRWIAAGLPDEIEIAKPCVQYRWSREEQAPAFEGAASEEIKATTNIDVFGQMDAFLATPVRPIMSQVFDYLRSDVIPIELYRKKLVNLGPSMQRTYAP
jgi:hypothetical protein